MHLSPWPSRAYRHKGIRSPKARINKEIVNTIRSSKESLKTLAERYMLNPNYVWEIKHKKKWKD